MKAGADDFVTKPYEPDHLRFLVQRILERRRLIDELEQLRTQMREDYSFHNMVSKSPKMRRVFDLIEQVGPLGSTVLIYGETGTGKELVAQAIHAADTRRDRAVRRPELRRRCTTRCWRASCSATSGARSPAPTGARRGGSSWPTAAPCSSTRSATSPRRCRPSSSASSSRGTFERVGGTETIKVDVRIVAASNKRLEDEVKAGRFRSDLFYRLNVIRIDLPPLRERPEDIPLLAMHFLEKFTPMSTPPVTEIDSEAMQALLDHTWPGHVRELENAIKAAVAMADGTVIHRDALPATVAPRAGRPVHGQPADRHRTPPARPDRRPDRPGRARLLRPAPGPLQGQRRPLRQAQRPLAAERHPEAPEVRPRPHPIQGPRRARRHDHGRGVIASRSRYRGGGSYSLAIRASDIRSTGSSPRSSSPRYRKIEASPRKPSPPGMGRAVSCTGVGTRRATVSSQGEPQSPSRSSPGRYTG